MLSIDFIPTIVAYELRRNSLHIEVARRKNRKTWHKILVQVQQYFSSYYNAEFKVKEMDKTEVHQLLQEPVIDSDYRTDSPKLFSIAAE